MMRWNPETVVEVAGDRGAIDAKGMLDAAFAAIARIGVPTLVVTALVTVLILTLLFGLTAQDAVAGARWCPKSC